MSIQKLANELFEQEASKRIFFYASIYFVLLSTDSSAWDTSESELAL